MNSEPELIASQTTTNCNLASISDSLSDNNQFKYDSIEKKAVHLRLILEKDFKAADLKWSLFVAAAFSFRYETSLRPFPPLFLRKGSKDMDALLILITDVPALDLLLQRLDDLDNLVNMCDIIDLLFFVLVRLREPNIKTAVPHESHEAILNIVNSPSASSAPYSSKPQYIFQIISSPKSKAELQWKELAKNHRTFHAYYGGRLEHFYSILNLGFNKYLYKKTALGRGIYLSPELSTSLSYSLGGFGWGASCLGSHLCCVAICEVIDAPDGINYQIPSSTQGDRKSLDDKSGAGENVESRSNYFVTNCELVRIRYLLVYAKQPSSLTSGSIRDGGAVQQWVGRHKLFSVLLGYGLMLATIGFANNQPIQFYYQVLLKKLEVAINTMKA